jgi:hypothetical protein
LSRSNVATIAGAFWLYIPAGRIAALIASSGAVRTVSQSPPNACCNWSEGAPTVRVVRVGAEDRGDQLIHRIVASP